MGGFTKAEGLFLYVLILIHIGVAIYALWMTNFLFFIFYLLSGGIFWALYRKKCVSIVQISALLIKIFGRMNLLNDAVNS